MLCLTVAGKKTKNTPLENKKNNTKENILFGATQPFNRKKKHFCGCIIFFLVLTG